MLCLAACCLSILIYFFGSIKYAYPNIVFVYMAVCYAMHSVIHLVALSMGRSLVSCQKLIINSDIQYVYLSHETDNNYCFVTLILVYYFKMASLSWWLYLALAWLLIVSFKVNLKSVSHFSAKYSHYIGWLLPAFKLIFPIALTQPGSISELTGVCSVGDLDKNTLLNYLILPTCIYLGMGLIALILGFTKIIINREKAKKSFQSNKNLVRTGLVCLVILLAFLVIVSCELYEYVYMDSWLLLPKYFDLSSTLNENEAFNSKIKNFTSSLHAEKHSTITPVFVTKIFMQFVNAFLILFLLSVNSKRTASLNNTSSNSSLCARFVPKRNFNDIYSSNVTDNPELSYQFYPTPPPIAQPPQTTALAKLQTTRCDCAYRQSGLTQKLNDFNEHHHYCTPHALFIQSDTHHYGCACTPTHLKTDEDASPKLSTFIAT